MKHIGVEFYENTNDFFERREALVLDTVQEGIHCASAEIGAPEPRTYQVDVPGRNGLLDASESVFGGALSFKNREIKINLWTEFDTDNHFQSFLLNKLHGKKMRFVIGDDPSYYWVGRLTVETAKINLAITEAVITADCEPFKYPIPMPGVEAEKSL